MELKEKSYYKTGGTCERVVYPENSAELSDLIVHIRREKTRYFVLGAGSNSLIMDDHWPGIVISLSRLQGMTVLENLIKVDAGISNTLFAEKCLELSLAGASWMYYLPGLLGSAIRMNARCYGGETGRIISRVTVVDTSGNLKTYKGSDVFLGYKKTIFMDNAEIIVGADISLEAGDPYNIRNHMQNCRKDREKKHQFLYPSCGCVFKNNYEAGVPAGLLLEESDVRKISRPGVEISPYHANFVFNKGATARDILEVTLEMRKAVYRQFGVWLEYEMEVLGLVPEDLQETYSEKQDQDFNLQRLNPLRERFSGYRNDG